MLASQLTIVVNSTDSHADCWEPFFYLLKKHWKDALPPIVLITDFKSIGIPGVNLVCTQCGRRAGRRIPWGEAVLDALNYVSTDLLLYLQEDYFLDAPVNVDRLRQCVELFASREVSTVRLVEVCEAIPFLSYSAYPGQVGVFEVTDFASYKVSLQAAIWRKSALAELVRTKDSPWDFERYARFRQLTASHGKALCIEMNNVKRQTVFPLSYLVTALIRGQWHTAVPSLLGREAIEID